MAYKWLPLTEDFDRSLGIEKIRWDTSVVTYTGTTDYCGYFAEVPNQYADGLTWDNTPNQSPYYIRQNRWNPTTSGRYAPNTFCNRYYNFTDERWSAQTHTTLVSGTTYEFVCPIPLYYAGLQNDYVSGLADKIFLYVNIPFEISPESMEFSYSGGTSALTITSDGGWSASTNSEWITLSSESGSGDSTINITASANSGIERTGTVSITDGNDTLTCSISQGFKPILIPFCNIYYNGNRLN